jgi:hypothetical protein
MVKVVSLKKSAADKAADKKAMGTAIGSYEGPESDGVSVHLDHDHLTKMGVHGNLKSGDKVEYGGHGHVESSRTESHRGGEKHSATIRMTHMGVSLKGGEDDHDDIRKDVQSSYDTAEKKRGERAKLAAGRGGKEVAEKR